MDGAWRLLLARSNRYTPERAAVIEACERRRAIEAKAAEAEILRQDSDLDLDYWHIRFGHVQRPRERCDDAQFAKYMAVHDELQRLIDFPGQILLTGATGTGKTCLAAMALHAFCDAGLSAFYTTLSSFYSRIQHTWKDEAGPTEWQEFERFRNYNLLVVDEIGVHSRREWARYTFRNLLTRRCSGWRATIMTTNLTIDQLLQPRGTDPPFLDGPLTRRISDYGAVIVCDWPSFGFDVEDDTPPANAAGENGEPA